MQDIKQKLTEEIGYIPIVRLETIKELLKDNLAHFISNPKDLGFIMDAHNQLSMAIELLHKAEASLAEVLEA